MSNTNMAGAAVRYIPILKGKLGELDALRELLDVHRPSVVPLLEVVPPGIDDYDVTDIERELVKFLDRLASRWHSTRPIILDTGYFPEIALTGDRQPIEHLVVHAVSAGLQAIPVVRPSDPPTTRRAVRNALEAGARSVAVRLAGDDLDDEIAPYGEVMFDLLHELGIGAAQAELIVDFGVVTEDTVTRSAQVARLVLTDLLGVGPWISVTVASGAFPAELSSAAPEKWGEFPRADLSLWRTVAQRLEQRGQARPQFGDYAIAHPALQLGPGFAPAPQIRYTADTHWLVMRGRKGVRRGHAQFYDICERLVNERAGEWSGPELSYGDDRIWKAAQSAPEGATPLTTPGNATTWRTIGTSHHIAHVVSRLTNPFAF